MEARPVSRSYVTMTEMVLPPHTNSLDSVFGGVIMSWIDIAAAISAQRHSGMPVVTASIDDLHFFRPIYKGWVVNLKASVNFAHHTSMEVGVRVEAENPITGEVYHSTSAYSTFVALGPDGKPATVPPLLLENDIQRRRHAAALQRRKIRLERRALRKQEL